MRKTCFYHHHTQLVLPRGDQKPHQLFFYHSNRQPSQPIQISLYMEVEEKDNCSAPGRNNIVVKLKKTS